MFKSIHPKISRSGGDLSRPKKPSKPPADLARGRLQRPWKWRHFQPWWALRKRGPHWYLLFPSWKIASWMFRKCSPKLIKWPSYVYCVWLSIHVSTKNGGGIHMNSKNPHPQVIHNQDQVGSNLFGDSANFSRTKTKFPHFPRLNTARPAEEAAQNWWQVGGKCRVVGVDSLFFNVSQNQSESHGKQIWFRSTPPKHPGCNRHKCCWDSRS